MAFNYYGKCTGTSSGKYDLWMSVTQNSQNILLNTSNITLKFYLKRNDGYASSAYNLVTSENSVKLVVGNSEKVNQNISIDTRNSALVTLASWNGDVAHNYDGSLTLELNGQFTMGNTTLSGGSVSGSFNLTTIPRASTATFSSSTVSPGAVLTVNISSASDSFTHRLTWSLGNKSNSVNLGVGVKTTYMEVPTDWISEITESARGALSVTLTTYKNSVAVGSKLYSVGLIIPSTDEYKPVFDIDIERIDNAVPAEWNEYVKGFTQIKINAGNLGFKYGATFAAATVTVGSVSKRTLPATFDLPISGTVKITLAVRDSRGLLTVKTTTIDVCDYNPPSVDIKSIARCTEEGVTDVSGTYLRMEYLAGYSDINGKNSYEVKVKYKAATVEGYSDSITLTDNPAVFGNGDIAEHSSYTVIVTVTDALSKEGVEILRSVTSAQIPFNIRRGGTGAAFGKFAENDNELSVNWDVNIAGDLSVSGYVNYENVECACSDSTRDILAEARYYPFLSMVYLRIRLTAAKALSANVTHTVATVFGKTPNVFSPLQSFVNFSSVGQSSAGVAFKTGDIVLRADTEIAEGSYIYINGFYIIQKG